MQAPGPASNERERLETLHELNVLDTPPEARFDRLTAFAARTFEVPIALISLIDENRQWFKSNLGLDLRETPRDISFCGHTILDDRILVVPDATKDARFSDNPLVTDQPKAIFYAGCPIVAPDGHAIGTFCIIDRAARTLSDADREALADITALATHELFAPLAVTQDELTGLLHRQSFLPLAERSLKLCVREALPTSLIQIQLQGQPNDAFRITFAEVLAATVRESDLCARMAEDEFAILLPSTAKRASSKVIGRIQKALSKPDRRQATFTFRIVQYNRDRHQSVKQMIASGFR